MRQFMKQLENKRERFRGTVERFGKKRCWYGDAPTILLTNITRVISGNTIADHLWFNETWRFHQANLAVGDTVEFTARVEAYMKGYRGYDITRQIEQPLEVDYKLSRPTKIMKI